MSIRAEERLPAGGMAAQARAPQTVTRQRRRDLLLVLLFASFILLPGLLHVAGVEQSTPENEMRTLVDRPRFPDSTQSWREFGGKLEAYLSDRFGLRPVLTAAASRLRFAIRVPVGQLVIIGKDGWLYWNGQDEMEQVAGVRLLSQVRIGRWIGSLVRMRDWAEARRIRFIFVIAPNKSEIYPEYLPDGLVPAKRTAADQLRDALARDGRIDFVDLRGVMHAAKATGQIYYKTDTHWNPTGAYYALQAVMKGRWPAGIELPPLSDYTVDRTPIPGDIAYYLMQECCLKEPSDLLVRKFHDPTLGQADMRPVFSEGGYSIDSEHRTYPRLFLLADSFAFKWFPLLPDVTSRTVFQWNGRTLRLSDVEKEKPDILIYEAVQRVLPYEPTSMLTD